MDIDPVFTEAFDQEGIKQSVLNEFSGARDLVWQCLSEDQQCRNDDHWLMLKVWQKQGLVIMVDYKRWKELYSFETIRRVRQEIQSTYKGLPGQLLPTDPDILIKRKIKEEAIRQYYGNHSWIMANFQVKKYGIGGGN